MKAIERALYRGKRLDNGEWVEGNYCVRVDGYDIKPHCIQVVERNDSGHIIKVSTHEVDRKTVGEWTGLEDKNGVKIFEGSYLYAKKYTPWVSSEWLKYTGDFPSWDDPMGDVEFRDGVFVIQLIDDKYAPLSCLEGLEVLTESLEDE